MQFGSLNNYNYGSVRKAMAIKIPKQSNGS